MHTHASPGAPVISAPPSLLGDAGKYEFSVQWNPPADDVEYQLAVGGDAADDVSAMAAKYEYKLICYLRNNGLTWTPMKDVFPSTSTGMKMTPEGNLIFKFGGAEDIAFNVRPSTALFNTSYSVAVQAKRLLTTYLSDNGENEWGPKSDDLEITTLVGDSYLPRSKALHVERQGRVFKIWWIHDPRISDPDVAGKQLSPHEHVEFYLTFDVYEKKSGVQKSRLPILSEDLQKGDEIVYRTGVKSETVTHKTIPTKKSPLIVDAFPMRGLADSASFRFGNTVTFSLYQRIAAYEEEDAVATAWSHPQNIEIKIKGLPTPTPTISNYYFFKGSKWFEFQMKTWILVTWPRSPAEDEGEECQYRLMWWEVDSEADRQSAIEKAAEWWVDTMPSWASTVVGGGLGYLAGGFTGLAAGAKAATAANLATSRYQKVRGIFGTVFFKKLSDSLF